MSAPPTCPRPPRTFADTDLDPIIGAILSLPRFGRAPPLNPDDLNKQGQSPMILTMAETAVLLTAISRGRVMLGVRLLVPRYDVDFVVEQIRVLSQVDVRQVKTLPYKAWEMLQWVDFNRSQHDPPHAPYFFYETRLGYYYYKMPVVRYPIDLLIEKFLHAQRTVQFTSAESMSEFGNRVAESVFRIRGGGGPACIKNSL